MKKVKPETLAVHAGFHSDPATGAVMPPIYQVSTYAQRSPGQHLGFEYSRTDNPTRTVLQTALAALEDAKHALAFSSGMAAVDTVISTLKPGDHVIAADDLYGGTYRHFTNIASERGIEFSFINLSDLSMVEAAFKEETKLVWLESPTNPLLGIIDIKKVAEIAHQFDARVCVDNTFMSPILQQPIHLGADIVLHSITKYIGGHSDVVMGCVMLNDDAWYERLKYLQNAVGAVPAPMDCFLALRGIRTLALRMKAHCENGMEIARYLQDHPQVSKVLYPGLTDHPGHEIAAVQASGFGGMISFEIKGGLEAAEKFLRAVKLFKNAESLGGVESLIEHPGIMTHASIPPEIRANLGISDGLIRISCGIEHHEDLIHDLNQAFKAALT